MEASLHFSDKSELFAVSEAISSATSNLSCKRIRFLRPSSLCLRNCNARGLNSSLSGLITSPIFFLKSKICLAISLILFELKNDVAKSSIPPLFDTSYPAHL